VTPLYVLLGRQIAHFRRKAGLTQEELAEKAGYSVDFISLVERGVNAPTVHRLKDIADIVGTEVWQLFYPVVGERSGKIGPARKRHKRGSSAVR
jgi:transcriptional regulator with XRE-family HTH domain